MKRRSASRKQPVSGSRVLARAGQIHAPGAPELANQNPLENLAEALNRYGSRLYSVSFQILRNSHDAEDAVQEALLKAVRSIETFRGEASIYTWLYCIVRNQ